MVYSSQTIKFDHDKGALAIILEEDDTGVLFYLM